MFVQSHMICTLNTNWHSNSAIQNYLCAMITMHISRVFHSKYLRELLRFFRSFFPIWIWDYFLSADVNTTGENFHWMFFVVYWIFSAFFQYIQFMSVFLFSHRIVWYKTKRWKIINKHKKNSWNKINAHNLSGRKHKMNWCTSLPHIHIYCTFSHIYDVYLHVKLAFSSSKCEWWQHAKKKLFIKSIMLKPFSVDDLIPSRFQFIEETIAYAMHIIIVFGRVSTCFHFSFHTDLHYWQSCNSTNKFNHYFHWTIDYSVCDGQRCV